GLSDVERIARSYPHQLSGGQRQRVVIAMALASEPEVLLCDEPTTALDVTVQRQVLELLQRLRRERGLTLVFVSHDIAVVADVCERLAVMRGVSIVEVGATRDLVRAPDEAYTRALLDALPQLPELAQLPGSDQHEGRAGAAAPVSHSAAPVLEAVDLEVRYGRAVALEQVSFTLEAAGALGVVGESGSGKTTLARALVGQLRPSSGLITLDGARLPRARYATVRRAVQLARQDPNSTANRRL